MNENKHINRVLISSAIILVGIILLVFGIALSISLGAKDIDLSTVFGSIFQSGEGIESIIVHNVRMPRALAAALVGAFLAVSGAMMQAITRNPIADPSIIGVTQGAILAMAVSYAFQLGLGSGGLMLFAFAGAGVSGLLVYFLSSQSRGGVNPIKLALAGVALGTLFISIATSISLYFNLAQQLSFWMAGGLTSASWAGVRLLSIVGIIGIGTALILSPKITLLSLGEEVAIGLGEKVNVIRLIGILTVILLSGSAVSVAGNIAFVGLIVPQILRSVIGPDYRYIIPCSLVVGATLLVYSDIVARMINQPYETPLGSITAIIGVPFFIYLVRSGARQ